MTQTGLTTTQAPFIERCRKRGETYIRQPYELYSEENQCTWRRLFDRIEPAWQRYACRTFLSGVGALHLSRDRIPKLSEVNPYLKRLTGFRAKPVAGYMPAHLFFDSLSRREFPTTITVRGAEKFDYSPEPDIFHDVAGHVPMHADREFADCLVRISSFAKAAVESARDIPNPEHRLDVLASRLKALARFFWFTAEFGLLRDGGRFQAYGSGLLSSVGELQRSVDHEIVRRDPLDPEQAANLPFDETEYQPRLFFIESFEQLYDRVEQLFRMLREGRLDNVTPGKPGFTRGQLEGFLRWDGATA